MTTSLRTWIALVLIAATAVPLIAAVLWTGHGQPLVLLAISMALAIVASIYLSARLTAPLKALSRAAAELAEDHAAGAAVQLPPSSVPEIHELAEAFARMRDRLAARTAEREQARRRLVRQSALLEGFFRHTITPLVFLDRQFNFIRVNQAYARACQREVDDFPGHNHFELYPHEENQRIFAEVVRTRQPFQVFAKPFSFPDHPEWGVTHWDWTLVPILDVGGEVDFLVFALRDITAQANAERRDRAVNDLLELFAYKTTRQEYLDAAVKVLADWIGCRCVGIRVREADGTIPYAACVGFDDSFCRIESPLSLSSDTCVCVRAVLGEPEESDRPLLTARGSFRSDDAAAFVAGLSPQDLPRYRGTCMRVGFKSLAVVPIRCREEILGAVHLADERAGLVGPDRVESIESMAMLIGEAIRRFRAEQAVREQAALLDLAHDAIFVRDAAGRITFWNPGAEATYGWPADEAIGRESNKLLGTGFPEPLQGILARVRSAGQWTGELEHRRKDGTAIFVASRWAAQYRDGQLASVLEINRDITARKQAEAELANYHERLEDMVRQRTAELVAANRELEAFAYSVSHDLRSPLRGIDGFSQALVEECADRLDDRGRGFLERIRAASQRMGQLIDDLLALSRVTRAPLLRERVNLSVLARRVADDLAAREPGRAVQVVIAPDLFADADERLMTIVPENLLGNAFKFTSRHATARIEFGASPSAGPDGRVECFVRDDGAGFDGAYANTLFAAFRRLHGAGEFPGSGIGLATVQRIIQRHGGAVRAEGAVENGAVVYFTL